LRARDLLWAAAYAEAAQAGCEMPARIHSRALPNT